VRESILMVSIDFLKVKGDDNSTKKAVDKNTLFINPKDNAKSMSL
jgi:hypothetical protein